jgi:putative ATP-binding cassette transporter
MRWDKRDGSGVLYQSMIFIPLILALVCVAAVATYAKLTLQRRWRDWLNAHVLDHWLTGGRYYLLNLVPGDHSNPEYRMAETIYA